MNVFVIVLSITSAHVHEMLLPLGNVISRFKSGSLLLCWRSLLRMLEEPSENIISRFKNGRFENRAFLFFTVLKMS